MADKAQCAECKKQLDPSTTILFGAPHDKELKRICMVCFENIGKKPEAVAEH